MIRYADDFIVTSRSKEVLETEVKAIIESFLRERGLKLSPEKTKITHITEGFDFLGQHIRRYPSGKLLIKPARKSVRSLLVRVKEIIREHYGSTAHLLIVHLNPMIRGWANYHRHVVSKRIFARVDALIFQLLWKWARVRHPRKAQRWIKRKYFERVGTRDWWFFGESADKEPRFQHLRLFHAAAVRIVRHVLVNQTSILTIPVVRVLSTTLPPPFNTVRVHSVGVRLGLSRVSWKLSRTVLRGGATGNGGSPLDRGPKTSASRHGFIRRTMAPYSSFAGLFEAWQSSQVNGGRRSPLSRRPPIECLSRFTTACRLFSTRPTRLIG